MQAVVYRTFGGQPTIESIADPKTVASGVVVKVMASGVCRSDWHGWLGHDPDIGLPHVPGHELAGVIEDVGDEVRNWSVGDRITVPFVGGCGSCPQCETGNEQVCDRQFQPGFTHFGSFADYVGIDYADTNLVRLPESMEFATAACLGCRFATSFRAIVDQGRIAPGEWLAVFGCGGVGLSAVMIARAKQARVIAIDVSEENLRLAEKLGANVCINSAREDNVVEAVRDRTDGGAHIALDAVGNHVVVIDSVNSLRKRGRHVQVGLLPAGSEQPALPMHRVIANELEIVGSHGMQAHRYDEMLDLIQSEALAPEKLIGRRISLQESIEVLTTMDRPQMAGIAVITRF